MDEPRQAFLQNLKQYVSLVNSLPDAVSSQPSSSVHVCPLGTIRKNCLSNGSAWLAAEVHPRTKNLISFARQARFPSRTFPGRLLPKIVKLVRSNKNEVDITKTATLQKEGLSLSFNCFKCPALAVEKESENEKGGSKKGKKKKDSAATFYDEAEGNGQEGEEGAGGAEMAEERARKVIFVDPTLAAMNVNR